SLNPQKLNSAQPTDATAAQQVTLSASASSRLPVSFTSTTPDICTVAGATVTTMAVGTCMITASQSGSDSYAAAPNATESFQVNPADQRSEERRVGKEA